MAHFGGFLSVVLVGLDGVVASDIANRIGSLADPRGCAAAPHHRSSQVPTGSPGLAHCTPRSPRTSGCHSRSTALTWSARSPVTRTWTASRAKPRGRPPTRHSPRPPKTSPLDELQGTRHERTHTGEKPSCTVTVSVTGSFTAARRLRQRATPHSWRKSRRGHTILP